MTSTSFYLGPRAARFVPTSWDDMVAAAGAGVLDETHWVELKEAVPPSSKSANLELARDLASLSVDGGTLIVGIADAGGSAGEVVGTELQGLETRLSQVASGRISPPLPVTIDVLRHPQVEGVGVVLVTVPASETAPHMVDDRYWGRDARGKRVLSDDEVRRLLHDRRARATGFAERLRGVPARLDPPGLGDRGRTYVLLEPAAAASQPLSDLMGRTHLLQVAVTALGAAGLEPTWGPSFDSVNFGVPHPDGIAASSTAGDDVDPDDDQFFIALLADDGALSVSAPAVRRFGITTDAPDVVSPGHLLETLHGAVVLAAHVADEYTGFRGAWRVGVQMTGLRGRLPTQAHSHAGMQRFRPYPVDGYSNTVDTTTREMSDHAGAVVGRLARGVLRGLGVHDRFLPYNDPREIARRSR